MKTKDAAFKRMLEKNSPLKKEFMVYKNEFNSRMIVKENLTFNEAKNECVKLQKVASLQEHYLIAPMQPAKTLIEIADFFVIDGK